MSSWLLVPLVIGSAAVCPLHMWWSHRRGRRAACGPLGVDTAADPVEAIRVRQRHLAAQISAVERTRVAVEVGRDGTQDA